jgi:hypothetical protein
VFQGMGSAALSCATRFRKCTPVNALRARTVYDVKTALVSVTLPMDIIGNRTFGTLAEPKIRAQNYFRYC